MAAKKKQARRDDVIAPKPDDPYEIAYFRRHHDDDPTRVAPGQQFLACVPPPIAARIRAVVIAVAKAPPHKFAGGGKWEAMSAEMAGIYEVRVDGPPNRTHYRLFCVLDTKAQGRGPLLVIIDGASKPFRTELPSKVYGLVRAHGTSTSSGRSGRSSDQPTSASSRSGSVTDARSALLIGRRTTS